MCRINFSTTQSLIALIRRHEPALLIGNWFSQPENAQRIGQHLLQIMSGFLELTDDARIQRLIKRAVHKAIDKVDLSGTSALMLESMTKNNRHQVLLDTLIAQLITLLQRGQLASVYRPTDRALAGDRASAESEDPADRMAGRAQRRTGV
ncbi:Predicted membrane protein [Citrobacter freundii]|nr:Predicted membrane protein [Citrobacter freundii]